MRKGVVEFISALVFLALAMLFGFFRELKVMVLCLFAYMLFYAEACWKDLNG